MDLSMRGEVCIQIDDDFVLNSVERGSVSALVVFEFHLMHHAVSEDALDAAHMSPTRTQRYHFTLASIATDYTCTFTLLGLHMGSLAKGDFVPGFNTTPNRMQCFLCYRVPP